MTNIELLAEDILRMKHRDKIIQVLPLFLTPRSECATPDTSAISPDENDIL